MTTLTDTPKLTPAQFRKVSEVLYQRSGIVIRDGKQELVQSRLARRLRATNAGSYDAYFEMVWRDESELARMVDVLTTNKTNFMREPAHFDLLVGQMAASWERLSEVRVWSAACSSGEEPYTIAMTLLDRAPELARRTRILATDLASHAIERCRRAEYSPDAMAGVPAAWRSRFFERKGPAFRVTSEVRGMVSFARLNLLDPWPMQRPFAAIFCRNVMIYFDKKTQLGLAERFRQMLEPEGYLLIGHAESLGTTGHNLRYVKPAVYAR